MSILVAMSGGVDSSVSAYLMTQKHDICRGATMLLFLNESLGISGKYPCCSRENIIDAKTVCDKLGIKHEILNYMAGFEEHVIKKFVSVYESGGTPNPCIDCNKYMKFTSMLEHANETGIEKIATGHYAIIEHDSSGRYLLRKAYDLNRDQSYVLYMLNQNQLAHTEFPLGCMKKSQVRELAENLNFTNAHKHDSQDICFVPDGDYASFIQTYTGHEYPSGNFIDTNGKVIGVHKGIIHYTSGQRRGLGVAAKSRLYVSEINAKDNTITLADDSECSLYSRVVIANHINLIAFDSLPDNFHAHVKIRYRQKEIPAVINQTGHDEFMIEFSEPQRMPAKGQSAVIYDGDYVIGGGIITRNIA